MDTSAHSLRQDETTGGKLVDAYDTVIVATPDLAGRLVGRRFTARHFEAHAAAGFRICDVVFGWGLGHELHDGFADVGWEQGYGDFTARPDLETLRPLDWWPRTALVMADAVDDTGQPLAVAPRSVLRRQLERAAQQRFGVRIASELEFTLFNESRTTLVDKGYTNLVKHHAMLQPELVETTGLDERLLGPLRHHLEQSGIAVESVKAEYSPGQVEIVLEPARALEMADRHAIYKLAVREIARSHGVEASFIAKWHHDFAGSSCHLHLSLENDAGENLFRVAGDDALLEAFLGGLERYARDVFLLWAPYPNSYKRFRSGTFAPDSLSWGVDNRTTAFRVCGNANGRHLENRIPGADVNPYLAYAAMLAAGLAGIDEGLAPSAGVDGNAYAAAGLPTLPRTLREAIDVFAESSFSREALGDAVVDHVVNLSRQELAAAELAVTDWDRQRLFDI